MTAKDGYFKAKREIVEAIDRRIILCQEDLKDVNELLSPQKVAELNGKIAALESMRNFVRNVMWWGNEENG